MLKKFPSDKMNGTEMLFLFFRERQLITVSLLICDSYMSWSTRFVSLTLCVGCSISDFVVSFLLKFIFLIKCMDSLNLKCHNYFQNENNRKATYSLAPRFLISKVQQEVLKFNDICMSWSSPKTDLETNF